MNYIVLDLEWNQPLRRGDTVNDPVPLHGEIIQIGAVKLDDKFNIKDSFKETVKPKYYRIINRHVQKLTGISQYQLEHGLDLKTAVKKFRHFCGRHCVWMIWGTDDIPIFRDNLLAHGMDVGWLPKYYNLQVMFNAQITGETRQWSLEDAMTALLIENEGLAAHDALNDAKGAALIAQKLDMKNGLTGYEANAVRMQYSVSHSQTTHFYGFANADTAYNDRNAIRSACPVCNKKLPLCKWVGNAYLGKSGIISCPSHGKFKVSLHASRSEDGSYELVKTVKTASAESIARYEEKLGQLKQRKHGKSKSKNK